MKEHKGVISLLKQAEAKQRCALSSSSSALYHALRRRVKSCELISPYPTLFARTDYWTQLNAEEQSLHMIRALATLHPQWTFAGLSAACVYGYQHAYSLHDGSVHIAGNSGITGRDHSKLNRIYMPRIPLWKCQGILVTSPARTLVDCSTFSFSSALAIYDSALCSGHVTVEEINTLAIQTNCDEAAVAKLLRYANPASENGGESFTRGQIILCDFAVPLLQVEFENPNNPAAPYRVDFCWKLADGRIIVAEYDGMAKYADTTNQSRASLQAKMEYERRREHDLKTQGVTTIVHLFYEDVMNPKRMTAMLSKAGVPRLW